MLMLPRKIAFPCFSSASRSFQEADKYTSPGCLRYLPRAWPSFILCLLCSSINRIWWVNVFPLKNDFERASFNCYCLGLYLQVLCNGPGTCIPICAISYLMKVKLIIFRIYYIVIILYIVKY